MVATRTSTRTSTRKRKPSSKKKAQTTPKKTKPSGKKASDKTQGSLFTSGDEDGATSPTVEEGEGATTAPTATKDVSGASLVAAQIRFLEVQQEALRRCRAVDANIATPPELWAAPAHTASPEEWAIAASRIPSLAQATIKDHLAKCKEAGKTSGTKQTTCSWCSQPIQSGEDTIGTALGVAHLACPTHGSDTDDGSAQQHTGKNGQSTSAKPITASHTNMERLIGRRSTGDSTDSELDTKHQLAIQSLTKHAPRSIASDMERLDARTITAIYERRWVPMSNYSPRSMQDVAASRWQPAYSLELNGGTLTSRPKLRKIEAITSLAQLKKLWQYRVEFEAILCPAACAGHAADTRAFFDEKTGIFYLFEFKAALAYFEELRADNAKARSTKALTAKFNAQRYALLAAHPRMPSAHALAKTTADSRPRGDGKPVKNRRDKEDHPKARPPQIPRDLQGICIERNLCIREQRGTCTQSGSSHAHPSDPNATVRHIGKCVKCGAAGAGYNGCKTCASA
jgi:hypothetical protein